MAKIHSAEIGSSHDSCQNSDYPLRRRCPTSLGLWVKKARTCIGMILRHFTLELDSCKTISPLHPRCLPRFAFDNEYALASPSPTIQISKVFEVIYVRPYLDQDKVLQVGHRLISIDGIECPNSIEQALREFSELDPQILNQPSRRESSECFLLKWIPCAKTTTR